LKEVNALNGKKLSGLRAEVEKKEALLRECGYTVKSIWECKWEEEASRGVCLY